MEDAPTSPNATAPAASGASPEPPGAPPGPPEATGRWAAFRARVAPVWRYAKWPTYIGGGLFLLGVLFFLILYATVDLPDEPPSIESSIVLDADGNELAVFQKDELRVEVTLDQVAPVVVDALVASEDRRFYDHGGIDPVGMARAFWHTFRGDTEGGSTLTQQLVKNTYLNSERSLFRKVKEGVLAIKLDRQTDKDEILERYLNLVYFGRGAYGIEAAARTYFDLSAAELQLHQAALLIGLLRAPESADPERDPDVAAQRRDLVLDAMVETAKVTEAEATEARRLDLGAIPRAQPVTLTAGVAPHFVEWVRQQAIAELGEAQVYGGGLRIHTTISLEDQQAAEAAIAQVLDLPEDPQAALVALDANGAVKAYVGGRDFNTLQVDLARGREGGGTGRQPGSTFKAFVLAAAAEQGIPAGTLYPAPAQLTLETDSGPWPVDNYGGEAYGVLDIIEGTVNSVNTVYAQLVLDVGPARAVDLARAAGVQSELPVEPSITLGTGEVSPLELTDAFLTFAREGERVAPYGITRIETADGTTVFEADAETNRAMKPETARLVSHILQEVIERGTGEAADIGRPAAGKTGTTQDNGDAWFAGYTPNYAAVVWMGYPEDRRPMDDVHGRAVTGGSFPAEIWRGFMEVAVADLEPAEFAPPPDELLAEGERPTASLVIQPTSGRPGTAVTASGSGYELCIEGWFITVEPGGISTDPQEGSNADQRSAGFTVPPGATPGTLRVAAMCDMGDGAQAVAEATFTVEGEPTTTSSSTTTTAPSSTTTTEPTTTTTEPTTTTEGGDPGG